MKKIPSDAFDYYFSLGPGRSYQQVADRYGVTKRAVTALAKRESWQARLADVESRYPGVTVVFGGEFETTQRAFADIGRAFLIAMLAIFYLMVAKP